MISAVIADDEAPARDELRFLLEQTGRITILAEATNGYEAVALCRRMKPQAVFLDIQMPGKSGLDAAREILDLDEPPVIIFQTAYDEFALQAFEVHAMDYLLKPLSPLRLEETLRRLEKSPPSMEKLQDLIGSLNRNRPAPSATLSLYKGDAIVPIKQGDILFLEARGKEVRIVTKRGEFLQNGTFGRYEKQLTSGDFFRCHRSFLINLTYVEQVDLWVNNTYMIRLFGTQDRIPVSRSHMADFRRIFHI